MSIETFSDDGFVSLFDGTTLNGWRTAPRVLSTAYPGGPHILDLLKDKNFSVPPNPEQHPARWYAMDGIIVGEQATETYGGYLISEEVYGDFELAFDANPDWPADTGVLLRRKRDQMEGIQVLIDHRKSGNIGGMFGSCLANFHATNYTLDVERDANGKPIGLKLEDQATSKEPLTQQKIDSLSYGCDPKDFVKTWKWADWNSFRVRVVGGPLPTVTTWINGLKIAELNMETLKWPNYNPREIAETLGPKGHIAFEVHDNDSYLGAERWAPGAKCRWRNIRIKDLSKPPGKI